MPEGVKENFLRPVAALFPMPRTDDIEAAMSAYVRALSRFSAETLGKAAQAIIETRQSRSFPLVAECLYVCRDIEAEAIRPQGEAPKRKEPHPEWTAEARREADRLLSTYAGRYDALRQGWAWRLWDFLRVNARWPNRMEADRIRAASAAANRDLEDAVAEGGPGVASLMAAREQKLFRLAAIINGNEPAMEDA